MRRVGMYVALVAVLVLPGCLPDLPASSIDYVPVAQSDGWPILTPAKAGISDQTLQFIYEQFYGSDTYATSRSLLIIRGGALVAEAYRQAPEDRDNIQNLQSITKSVLSILIGQAVDAGQLTTATTLGELVPVAEATAHGSATLHDLLTMQSGLDFDNDVHVRELVVDRPVDSLQFVLNLPQAFPPGARFNYSEAGPILAAEMLRVASSKTIETLAGGLFAQLGISDWQWEKHLDGREYGGFGLYLRPRDLAKIGLLMARSGQWNDKELVSAAWVAESTAARANLSDGPYGYFWWTRADLRAFAGLGHGGNVLYVIPDLDLVVVHTAMPYAKDINAQTEDIEDLITRLVLNIRANAAASEVEATP